jgi:hypothetical protein
MARNLVFIKRVKIMDVLSSGPQGSSVKLLREKIKG